MASGRGHWGGAALSFSRSGKGGCKLAGKKAACGSLGDNAMADGSGGKVHREKGKKIVGGKFFAENVKAQPL